MFGEGKIHTGWDGGEGYCYIKKTDLLQLLQQLAEPILTEDERVILKNLNKDYTIIRRTKIASVLQLWDSNLECWVGFDEFTDNLFQFVKSGEEYPIKELLGDEKK